MANERKFISENIKRMLVKEYIMEQIERAGFGGIDIQRTPMGTRVTLYTERPGIVIGHKGEAIKKLTSDLKSKFEFDNPQIEVEEVKEPNLNAQIMAEKLASALERGWHFRRAGHSTVRRIMDSGAKGCEIILSGKLTGQRHRVEKFKDGHIKFCGEPKLQWMSRGFSVAKLKLGVIGVVVWIMDPDARLPDEVSLISELEKKAKKVEKKPKVSEEKEDISEDISEKDLKKLAKEKLAKEKEERKAKPKADKEEKEDEKAVKKDTKKEDVKKDDKKDAKPEEKGEDKPYAAPAKEKAPADADKKDIPKEEKKEPKKDEKAEAKKEAEPPQVTTPAKPEAKKAEDDTAKAEPAKEAKKDDKDATKDEEKVVAKPAAEIKGKESKDEEEPKKGGE